MDNSNGARLRWGSTSASVTRRARARSVHAADITGTVGGGPEGNRVMTRVRAASSSGGPARVRCVDNERLRPGPCPLCGQRAAPARRPVARPSGPEMLTDPAEERAAGQGGVG